MPVRDIEDQLRDIYGVEVSQTLISNITDKILPQVAEWQNRPLDDLYPVVFFDGIWFKVRKDSKVIRVCVYSVLGVNMDGKKEILGIWNSASESASFWTMVFNDLKNRGVKDISGRTSAAVLTAMRTLKAEYGENFSNVLRQLQWTMVQNSPILQKLNSGALRSILRIHIPRGGGLKTSVITAYSVAMLQRASMEHLFCEYVMTAADELNGRPRRKLEYHTPEELFDAFPGPSILRLTVCHGATLFIWNSACLRCPT